MFWGRKFMIGAAALAALAGSVAAQAETIVVRASGPSAGDFRPGRKLADNVAITLKAGDVLTLLDGRGTRTLRGPGTFGSTASASAGSDTRTSLATLLESKRVMRARTGAVRGDAAEPAAAPRSPNLWYVDISQSSAACVPDPANVRIWRPSIAEASDVTISPAAGGPTQSVHFDAGQAVAWWPESLPVGEGTGYSLSWTGLSNPVTIRFAIMAPGSEGLETMASALISKQCNAQLNLLVETVALPDPAPDAGS